MERGKAAASDALLAAEVARLVDELATASARFWPARDMSETERRELLRAEIYRKLDEFVETN